MAKKPRGPGRPRNRPQPDDLDKTRMELRLDLTLVEKLKQAADEAGISLNQLAQALLDGCAAHLHQGHAYRSDTGMVCREERKGCLYIGETGRSIYVGNMSPPYEDQDEDPKSWQVASKGYIWFLLDFTGRAVVEVPQVA